MQRLAFGFVLGLFLCSAANVAAAPGAGTNASPIVIDAFPYAARGTTVGKQKMNASYGCGTQNESGPEVVYQIQLARKSRVTAWLEGDNTAVDVDIHILKSSTATSACVARNNIIAETDLDAGTHYLVVDTFSGDTKAGAYVLHVYAVGDAWYEQPIGNGVLWRARRYANQGGGANAVNELVVDLATEGVSVRAMRGNACQGVDATGKAANAVAAVNGGYFDTSGSGCAPISLLKADGTLVATNASTAVRGAFGLSQTNTPMVARTAMGADWPEAYQAQGGGPVLVDGGNIKQGASAWAEEGLSSTDFLNGTRARTFAGFTSTGLVHLGGVDEVNGSEGMAMNGLATFVGTEIGLYTAVNLDGGGSTTVWVNGATPSGVVSYPTDFGTAENPTHAGVRGVSGGFFVFAEKYNWPPRFQTQPVTTGAVGSMYTYDADAIDLDLDDTITFSLIDAPPGMNVDATTGVVSYLPDVEAPSIASVVLRASDGKGGDTDQIYSLAITGGMGEPEVPPDLATSADLASAPTIDGGGVGGRDLSTAGDVQGCSASGALRGGDLGALLLLLFLFGPVRRFVERRRVVKLRVVDLTPPRLR